MNATARHIETKGCVTVSVEPVGACGRLSVVPQQVGAVLSVRGIIPDGKLSVRGTKTPTLSVRGTPNARMDVKAVELNPSITCLLVCEVTTSKYLRVTPVEPMWVDVGLDIDYSVLSNTDWMLN